MKKLNIILFCSMLCIASCSEKTDLAEGKTFIVTFNSNNGSELEAIPVKQGEKINEPQPPTRNDYLFCGWYVDDQTFVEKWDFAVNTVTKDVTLYANWNAKKTDIASGMTGELTWVLCSDGTLTISGTGEMPDYVHNFVTGEPNVPWGMYKNKITSVIIDNSVSKVSSRAFGNCTNLTSVTIGKSVTFIGENVFGGSLTSIDVDNDNTAYSSEDGVLFNRAKTNLIIYPTAKTGAYTIPNSVNSIENFAFFGCRNLTSVAIPNSIKSIGNNAFNGCSGLTSVTIPNSITIIESFTFRSCSKLTSIIIPNSVTSIGNAAFYSCAGLTSVTIPNSVTSIGIEAFGNCASLTSINVDNNNTAYSSEDGVLFNKTKGMLLRCPAGKVGTYIIPNSVTTIVQGAFSECIGLTSVTIPNSVRFIGQGAFSFCTSLTSLTIPNSVTNIGSWTFSYCTGLTEIINESATPQAIQTGWNYFLDVDLSACTLRVPAASINAYRAAAVWKDFKNIVAI